MATDDSPRQMDDLLATPDLADALESEQFKRLLPEQKCVSVGFAMRPTIFHCQI